MASLRGCENEYIRREEVASLPLVEEERHERRVERGVSVEEIWREYETARVLLEIAEAVGNEEKARIQRERVQRLEDELRDAVSDEDYEDGRWC